MFKIFFLFIGLHHVGHVNLSHAQKYEKFIKTCVHVLAFQENLLLTF
jgi:hypothetical protein